MPLAPAERYRRYLAALGPAIEGSGGDQKTYEACRAAWGFGLDEAEAMAALREWNAGCHPPWSEAALSSKVASVYRRTTLPKGYMIEEADWSPPPRRAPVYPEDAEAYFCRCTLGDADPGVLAWVEARGLDVATFRAASAGFVVRGAVDGPEWASVGGRPWASAGYGVIIPLFDADGRLRSVRARWSQTEDDPIAGYVELHQRGPKALPPVGYDTAGLVMANLAGAAWLAGRVPGVGPAWISEGEPDFLTLTLGLAQKGRGRERVFGIISGSWSWEIAARFGEDDDVTTATHDDLQGRRYAEEIHASLHGRVRSLKRFVPRTRRGG